MTRLPSYDDVAADISQLLESQTHWERSIRSDDVPSANKYALRMTPSTTLPQPHRTPDDDLRFAVAVIFAGLDRASAAFAGRAEPLFRGPD
jgi:hypothetical protein